MSVEAALRDNEFDNEFPTDTDPEASVRSGTARTSTTATGALAVVLLAAGFVPVSQWLTTLAPPLVLPAALGTPHLVPPLRLTPYAGISGTQWAIDVLGALVALAVCWLWLRSSRRLAARPTRGRAFRATWGAVVLALVVGNLVRYVLASFTTHASLGNYALSVLLTTVFAALVAVVVALVPAAVTFVRGTGASSGDAEEAGAVVVQDGPLPVGVVDGTEH